MWRLFVPLRYLRISHADKVKFDLYIPLVVTVLFCLPLLSDGFVKKSVEKLDVLGQSSDLLSVLTGFFVAALAAVATFGNSEMDEPMAGTEPVKLDGSDLSRRRFLSYLFGYLAFVSIFAYILGFAFFGFQTYFIKSVIPEATTIVFYIFWVFYSFLMGNLLVNALLGLFYLTDRIHRPNRVVSFKKRDESESNGNQTGFDS
ncbi:hypothetical protein [Brucella pituitosa]|uniref:hypothetical protein n=1 Tax=Brucella pituitosa TaxID=571256 RepID=UPI0012601ABA|nr:hypothetical protein [Brucella pituitosa]